MSAESKAPPTLPGHDARHRTKARLAARKAEDPNYAPRRSALLSAAPAVPATAIDESIEKLDEVARRKRVLIGLELLAGALLSTAMVFSLYGLPAVPNLLRSAMVLSGLAVLVRVLLACASQGISGLFSGGVSLGLGITAACAVLLFLL